MNRTRLILSAAALLTTLVLAPAAQAQATRTWVSGVGDDVNPCSRTAPCKTFAGAISKTAAGGEISVLDPGGFGAVTITKSITINGEGTLAGILASLTNGITVNAGVNDKVILRNIWINGAGNGLSGIRYLAGKQLVIEDVTIDGFTNRGVDVSLAGSGVLEMRNVQITKVATGVRLNTTAGAVTANLEGVSITSVTTGLELASLSSFATIRNSVLTSCTTALLANANTSVINAESNTLSFNTTAVNAAASGSTIRLSDNAIFNNTTGIAIGGGAFVQSDGSNRVQGNGASAAPNGVLNLD
ncbi:MAG TPA: right-handed parallel beta-helix repeat-containing protein [Thermoanaerobaculia bacterium]|nr:right-handed parallel beta-helix repeat-containing protein [Thermoanaerobaculia bacterium]